MTFGEYLKSLRKKSCMTIKDASAKANLSMAIISFHEKGKGRPSPTTIKKYAKLYGVEPTEIASHLGN